MPTITSELDARIRNSHDALAHLLYRRQFILGSRFLPEFKSWQKLTVRDSWCLSVHPDLNAEQVSDAGKTITLLGYILDPSNPSASNQSILQVLARVLSAADGCRKTIEATSSLGGRWILLVDDGDQVILFSDATGNRQAFYSEHSYRDEFWCASQPGLIADVLHLQRDATAQTLRKIFSRIGKEYIFPGDSSFYARIRHLLPNHALSLDTGHTYRFWPDRPLDRLSLEECTQRSAERITGLIKSASYRFPLSLSISAGRDTRLALAASREVKDALRCFTLRYWNMTFSHPDITIPPKLLTSIGVPHTVIDCPKESTAVFHTIFMKNVDGAHEAYSSIAEALWHYFHNGTVCMKGITIPIAKRHYQSKLPASRRRTVNPHLLADLLDLRESALALQKCDEWLHSFENTFNYDVLDLFEWEIREGNWQAMAQLEFDIAHEVFSPFNCRELLVTLLSLDPADREPPRYRLHDTLIRKLWPEILSQPINPPADTIRSLKSTPVLRPFMPYLRQLKHDWRYFMSKRLTAR